MKAISLLSPGSFLLLISLCLILSTDVVAAQSADDHGDTFATATPLSLGSSIAGRIETGNDMDVFKLDLSVATDVWAYTIGPYDTVGGLYDSNTALLAFNDDGFRAGSERGFSLRSNVPPGIHYVVVVSYDAEPGDYVLRVEAVTDPGSSAGTAAHLVLGSPAGGTIDTRDDADYFRLHFNRSTHAIIEARSTNYVPISADLLDAQGREISANVYPLIVRFGLRFTHGFRILDDFDPGTYYIRVTTPADLAPRPAPYAIYAYEDTDYADYIKDCEARTRALNALQIRDPLYGCQRHLNNPEGEDINVESAWADGVKGEGVNVAVVDDGMDFTHEDLRDNVATARNHDYTGDGSIFDLLEHHGTHVSGIIAARDNTVGVRGVAPGATIYGYNFLADPTFINEVDAMTRNGVVTAVSNNSWGSLDGPGLSAATSFWEMAVNTGITTGYNGKGTFYVFSAGNGHLLGDNSNLDEYVNHYGVTAVCSVNSRYARAGYSETDRYHFNHEYGFGVADAGATVALAEGWTNAPALQSSTVNSSETSVRIPDAADTGDPTTVVSELTLESSIGFTEFVEVNVAFVHGSFRDLEIELESPSGAVSELAVPFDTYTDYYDPFVAFVPLRGAFRFGSARHLGEDPNGVWKLRVTDRFPVADGALEAWSLTVYGHAPTPDAPTVDSVTPSPGSLAVAWTASVQTTGSEVTAYDLRHIQTDADETMDSNWTVVEDVWAADVGGDLEYAVIGLTGGAQYDVQLRAINEWGAGDWSAALSATPQNALPSFNEGATAARSVAENTPEGGAVGDPVAARDDDAALAYTLAGPDAALFEIVADTGQIRVGATTILDFEDSDNPDHEYQVTVTATDPSGASATVTVTIAVTDLRLGEPGDTYDTDHNEIIDGREALDAVDDYLDGRITKDEVLGVIVLYFFG